MHISSSNDKQIPNEFENVFNQLKKRSSNKRNQSNDEIIFTQEEIVQTPVPIEDKSIPLLIENEPIIPVVITPIKKIDKPSINQTPNRRKTVGGVNLMGNNKVTVDDNNNSNKPASSWIDIAKQKQNKL